jgi:hypothetical protein
MEDIQLHEANNINNLNWSPCSRTRRRFFLVTNSVNILGEVAKVRFLPVLFSFRHDINVFKTTFLAAFLKYRSQIKASRKNTSSSTSTIYLTCFTLVRCVLTQRKTYTLYRTVSRSVIFLTKNFISFSGYLLVGTETYCVTSSMARYRRQY